MGRQDRAFSEVGVDLQVHLRGFRWVNHRHTVQQVVDLDAIQPPLLLDLIGGANRGRDFFRRGKLHGVVLFHFVDDPAKSGVFVMVLGLEVRLDVLDWNMHLEF